MTSNLLPPVARQHISRPLVPVVGSVVFSLQTNLPGVQTESSRDRPTSSRRPQLGCFVPRTRVGPWLCSHMPKGTEPKRKRNKGSSRSGCESTLKDPVNFSPPRVLGAVFDTETNIAASKCFDRLYWGKLTESETVQCSLRIIFCQGYVTVWETDLWSFCILVVSTKTLQDH